MLVLHASSKPSVTMLLVSDHPLQSAGQTLLNFKPREQKILPYPMRQSIVPASVQETPVRGKIHTTVSGAPGSVLHW